MERRTIEQRELVIKKYLEGKEGYKKIAKEVGVPLNTVKTWVRRYKIKNGILDRNTKYRKTKKPIESVNKNKEYEKRIKQLEMEVELLRDFLYMDERRLIEK